MKKLIAGNWKMNLDREAARALMTELLAVAPAVSSKADLLVCPPYVHLDQMAWLGKDGIIALGAQDCSPYDNGAYTGDVSALMLKGAGCTHVILGHSERRQYYKETSKLVAKKASKAHEQGLTTIICIGETENQREQGQETLVVEKQLKQSLPPSASIKNTVIAYEPVWAIGTGKTATPDDVKAMHAFIREKLPTSLKACPILYGGSMKPENAKELLATANVDGGLIGGASLKADQFIAIAKSA